ncbi:SKP1-like protein 1A [Mercurialis annua]|uniref:SKP1-like protein 1A n=1 Tax=Mercurialis annua TaxID=3986 RepID=UPI00216058E5|nr:SKP1-like protein 1A [Mercurialis annua]
MGSNKRKTTITLKTSDELLVEVEKSIIEEMETIKNLLDDTISDPGTLALTIVPVPEVSSEALAMIVEYLTKSADLKALKVSREKTKAYGTKFVKRLNDRELLMAISAVNYLNVKHLIGMLQDAVADRIKNKSVEYVREFFNIKGDFREAKEKQLRQENEWAYEGVDED